MRRYIGPDMCETLENFCLGWKIYRSEFYCLILLTSLCWTCFVFIVLFEMSEFQVDVSAYSGLKRVALLKKVSVTIDAWQWGCSHVCMCVIIARWRLWRCFPPASAGKGECRAAGQDREGGVQVGLVWCGRILCRVVSADVMRDV